MRNLVYVNLKIEDEQGKPIPYVTVWGYVLPRESPLAINADDLWRQTIRFQSTFDLVTDDPGNKPLDKLEVYVLSDVTGHCNYKIDYLYLEGSAAKVPDAMYVGFAVMKRGYLPEYIDFKFAHENSMSAKVVMKRDVHHEIETKSYLSEFEKIRYELSDDKRNEEISLENDARLKGLRVRMESLAKNAEAVGDKAAAARIYARMRHFPAVLFYNGKPAGYAHVFPEPHSKESVALLEKAYLLDKDNPYLASKFLFRKMSEIYAINRKTLYSYKSASEAESREYMAQLETLKGLMEKHGEEIWPFYHAVFAHRLSDSSEPSDREKSSIQFEELKKWEPKYK